MNLQVELEKHGQNVIHKKRSITTKDYKDFIVYFVGSLLTNHFTDSNIFSLPYIILTLLLIFLANWELYCTNIIENDYRVQVILGMSDEDREFVRKVSSNGIDEDQIYYTGLKEDVYGNGDEEIRVQSLKGVSEKDRAKSLKEYIDSEAKKTNVS